MALIDDRGRLFGRVNLIDAFVALVALGLVPLAYGAFLLFRAPVPRIDTLVPSQVPADQLTRVQITGENLREALGVYFGTVPSGGFLVRDSGSGEIIVPGLSAGVYDLNIFDGARLVGTVPQALTVVAPPPVVRPVVPPPPPVRKGLASLRVRFAAEPEVLRVMKVGDVDVEWGNLVEAADRAVLTEIGADREKKTAVVADRSVVYRDLQVEEEVLVFTASVRVPVIFARTGWSYKDRPIKAGAPFKFETVAGVMSGWIVEMSVGARR